MPEIRKSVDLRNKYGEISRFCHTYNEPVFITKNGEGDLAVMSIGAYNELAGKAEAYRDLLDGMRQIRNGKTVSDTKIMKKLDRYIG